MARVPAPALAPEPRRCETGVDDGLSCMKSKKRRRRRKSKQAGARERAGSGAHASACVRVQAGGRAGCGGRMRALSSLLQYKRLASFYLAPTRILVFNESYGDQASKGQPGRTRAAASDFSLFPIESCSRPRPGFTACSPPSRDMPNTGSRRFLAQIQHTLASTQRHLPGDGRCQ